MYQVLLEWYLPQQGGRQQPPRAGRYFATTYFNEPSGQSMWSISLLLSASSINNAELEFLFDTYPKVIQVGDLLPILEGTKTVGLMLVLSVIEEARCNSATILN